VASSQAITGESDREAVAETPPPTSGAQLRIRPRGQWLSAYALIIAFVLMIVVYSVLAPSTFPTWGNARTIIGSQAVLLLLTLGLTIPLIAGDFDLSIGSLLGLSAVMCTWLTGTHGWAAGPAIVACIALGLAVGALNAFFIVKVGVGAFIATLASGTILTGVGVAISNGQVLSNVAPSITSVASGTLFGLPWPVYITLAFAIFLWYIYEHTPTGRYLFFLGAGRDTARLAGLRVDTLRWGAFISSALVASVAGILAAGSFGGTVPGFGDSYLLPAFAGAFLGATAIKAGRFNVWGTVIAVYFVVTGVTGLQLLGVSDWVEQVFNGTALLVAVSFGVLTSRARRP
jgi:ribose transport system permease protein